MLRGRLRGAVIGELKAATGDESAAFDVDECVTHWLRSNGAQLHNTAAVLGGIASQVWRCGVVCLCLSVRRHGDAGNDQDHHAAVCADRQCAHLERNQVAPVDVQRLTQHN